MKKARQLRYPQIRRKWWLVAVPSLCALLAGCETRDAFRTACLAEGLKDLTGSRWIEPRLSVGFARQACKRTLPAGHVVEMVLCPRPHPPPPPVSFSVERCDEAGRKHVKALRTLVLSPDDTEEAVVMLETLAAQNPSDALVLNDLAAAYRVRAQRTDRPSDLLSSFDAAERAVGLSGRPEARFNLALARQSLRLTGAAAPSGAVQWQRNRQELAAAVRAGDRQTLERLVRPFPDAAGRYLEEEVLPEWAGSDGKTAEQRLALARMIAGALARHNGDPYLEEAVEVIDRASGPRRDAARLAALRQGHLAFGRARLAERAHRWGLAEEAYGQARQLLASAGSPLQAGAELGLATARFQRAGEVPLSQVRARLDPLAAEAHRNGYQHLLGRVLWIRALCLFFESRAVEALQDLDRARGSFERMRDGENVAGVRVRKTGFLRALGESELAWREVLQALPHLPRTVELQSQHHLLGEAAAAALALGHPKVALSYQDEAVRRIRTERDAMPREQAERISGLDVNLAIALRERAVLLLHAGHLERALQDLDRAIALAAVPSDATARRALEARVQQAKGQTLLMSDPSQAVAALERARRLSPVEYHTLQAVVSFELARGYRSLGLREKAEQALIRGIRELRKEEHILLDGRQRGEGEELWGSYFSRFQDAYKLLIRLLVEDERPAAAFAYAERARAFEPLNLVLRLPYAPVAFRRLAANGEPLRLEEVRRRLPRGTFLIEYCALDDRLLIWVVWRGGSDLLIRKVGRATLERWTADLRAKALARNVRDFEHALAGPYADLIAAPLARIADAGHPPREIKKLIFIPDGAIHGLPLAALHPVRSRRYVIEDHAVAVSPSATLYVFSLLRDRDLPVAVPVSALLVGDPAFDAGSDLTRDLSRLPGAAAEVEDIRHDYPGAVVLTGRDATVGRFLGRAGESAVVHFAGHAITNPRSPFRSLVVLAPGEGRSGLLSAEELLSELRLEKTRLVVLAACSSAGGHPIGPEGLAPLVRPLIAAGAPAVVGSLWDVGAPSRELLVEFHRRYAAGEDAESALRSAQLHLLGKRPALAWAPFQVIGRASSPFP